jgi:anti-sigma factor RsiW
MNCHDAKKWMERWSDGAMDVRLKEPFERHLKSCPACQKEAAKTQAFSQVLRASASNIEPSLDFDTRFWEKVAARQKAPWYSKLSRNLDDWMPVPNLAQVVVMGTLALLIGSAAGAYSLTNPAGEIQRENTAASVSYLSGTADFNGIPASSMTAAYLKMTQTRSRSL